MENAVEDFTGQTSITLAHALGYKPDIWIEDANGLVIYGAVTHASINQLAVAFAKSQSGTIHYEDKLTSTSTVTTLTEAFTAQTYLLVQHNLGFYPKVWIENSSGLIISYPLADITHMSINAFKVEFFSSQSGTIHWKDFIYSDIGFTKREQLEVIHNLGYKPDVWFLDDDLKTVIGKVSHTTINKFQVNFNDPQSGRVLFGDVEYDYRTNVTILTNITVVDSDLRNVFPRIDDYKQPEWADFAKVILDEKKALYRELQQKTGKTDTLMLDIRDLKTEEIKKRIVTGALVRIFKASKSWDLMKAYSGEKKGIPLAYHDDVDGDIVFDEGERVISQTPVFSAR